MALEWCQEDPMTERPTLEDNLSRAVVEPRSQAAWRPWAANWCGVLALAFVNGGVHRAYEPALGVLPAEQLSNATLLALTLAWAARVDHKHPTSSSNEALGVGAMWGLLTVAFEFLGGHYLNGASWQTLLNAYEVTAGHLWPLAVVGIALAPLAARRRRIRKK
jgi:hypothetical protein